MQSEYHLCGNRAQKNSTNWFKAICFIILSHEKINIIQIYDICQHFNKVNSDFVSKHRWLIFYLWSRLNISSLSLTHQHLIISLDINIVGEELFWINIMVSPAVCIAKVAEDRKLTLSICTEPNWLWAGVQHGQVQSSWHSHSSPVLFVTVNNICFFNIRIGHEWASSRSFSFSSNLGC